MLLEVILEVDPERGIGLGVSPSLRVEQIDENGYAHGKVNIGDKVEKVDGERVRSDGHFFDLIQKHDSFVRLQLRREPSLVQGPAAQLITGNSFTGTAQMNIQYMQAPLPTPTMATNTANTECSAENRHDSSLTLQRDPSATYPAKEKPSNSDLMGILLHMMACFQLTEQSLAKHGNVDSGGKIGRKRASSSAMVSRTSKVAILSAEVEPLLQTTKDKLFNFYESVKDEMRRTSTEAETPTKYCAISDYGNKCFINCLLHVSFSNTLRNNESFYSALVYLQAGHLNSCLIRHLGTSCMLFAASSVYTSGQFSVVNLERVYDVVNEHCGDIIDGEQQCCDEVLLSLLNAWEEELEDPHFQLRPILRTLQTWNVLL